MVQGHSHIAFLGWGYFAVIGAVLCAFIPKNQWSHKAYKVSLIILFLTVILMSFSFPFTGYKVMSIALLTIFGITSYVLSFKLLCNIRSINTSSKFIRYGIYYYLLSSLATWFLVYVIIVHGKTDLYYNSVYFYLHFLYNGFFVFTLFGLLFKVFEKQQIQFSTIYGKMFFIYLNVACIPAYALSILWSKAGSVFYVIGFAASILQLISLYFLIVLMFPIFKQLKWSKLSKFLLKFLLVAYSFKIISQVLSSFPYVVEKSMALKPFFIIGYLHLFTLGFMSVFLFLILIEFQKIKTTFLLKIGVYSFLIGVIFTEITLFYNGISVLLGNGISSNYNLYLFYFSAIIVLGIFTVVVNQFFTLKKTLN